MSYLNVIEDVLKAIDVLHVENHFKNVEAIKEFVKQCLTSGDLKELFHIPCEYIDDDPSICGEKLGLIHLVIAKRIQEFRKLIEEILQIKLPSEKFNEVP